MLREALALGYLIDSLTCFINFKPRGLAWHGSGQAQESNGGLPSGHGRPFITGSPPHAACNNAANVA